MLKKLIHIVFALTLLSACGGNERHLKDLQGWEIKDLHFPDPERDARAQNKISYIVYEDTSTYYFDEAKKYRNLVPDSIMKAVYNKHGNELVHITQSFKRFGRGFSYSTYNNDGLIVNSFAGGCMSETFDYRYSWQPANRTLYMVQIWEYNRLGKDKPAKEDTMMLYLFDTAGRLSGTVVTHGANEKDNWLTWYIYDNNGRLVKTITDKMYAFIYGDKYSDKAERRTTYYRYKSNKLRAKIISLHCYECDRDETAYTFYDEKERPYKGVFHDTVNILIHTSTDTAYVSKYLNRNTRY